MKIKIDFILYPLSFILFNLERETRVELATSTLARSRSTTELLPRQMIILPSERELSSNTPLL